MLRKERQWAGAEAGATAGADGCKLEPVPRLGTANLRALCPSALNRAFRERGRWRIARMILTVLGLALLWPRPMHAQLDTRYRWALTGGVSIVPGHELYDGTVRIQPRVLTADTSSFRYPIHYTERLALSPDAWLRLEVTRNETHFLALRARGRFATAEPSLRGSVAPYRSAASGSFLLHGDVLVGFNGRGTGGGVRLYTGPSLGRAWVGSGRSQTASAYVVFNFEQDSLIRVRLPWRGRSVSSYGGLVGGELRVPVGSRLTLGFGFEQRIERVNVGALDRAHEAEFQEHGQSLFAFYEPYLAFPRAVTFSAEWHMATRRKADPRRTAVAAVRATGGDTPERAAQDWRLALPRAVRATLLAADTTEAIAQLETELAREPRNPLLMGTLGVLLAERASLAESDFQERDRATRLLEDALRLDPNNPRYLMGLAIIYEKRLMPTDARRVQARAFEAAALRPDQVAVEELTEALYRVGSTLEQRVIETEGLRTRPPPTDGQLMMALNLMGERTREILLSPIPVNEPGCEIAFCLNWARPREFYTQFREMLDLSVVADSLRRELVDAFEQALDLDPGYANAHRSLMAAWARAGRWDEVLAQATRYHEARPRDPWGSVFLASAHYWQADVAAADSLFRAGLAALPASDRRMFQDLSVLLSAAEETTWTAMDDARQSLFRQVYWRMRDPLFISGVNEREIEHAARVALAELLFGEPQNGLRGWETDRGQILIRYGRPLSTWQVARRDATIIDGMTSEEFYRGVEACLDAGDAPDAQEAMRSCFEALEREIGPGVAIGGRWIFWNYHPDMPSFIFEKSLGRATVRHMARSESLAFAEELRSQNRLMYDAPYRDAGALTYQAARFRGRDPERHEVVFYAQAPVRGLAASPADSVLRGVVLHAGPELLQVARQVERSPIGDGQMNYRVVVSPGTYSYALEALGSNGRTSTSSRGRLDIEPVRPGLAMSDLLLTSFVALRRDIPNPAFVRELDLRPLRCMAVPPERVIGFAFEAYGLTTTDGVARYRVTLETGATGAAGGGVVARVFDTLRRLVVTEPEAVDGRLTFDRQAVLEGGRDRVVDWFELVLPDELAGESTQFTVTVTDLATGQSVQSDRRVRSAGCS